MKILLVLTFILVISFCVKAQDQTIGQTKAQNRALIGPNSPIKLSKGENCDTLSLQEGMHILMYYKNDTCYESKSIMHLKYENYVTDKMTQDSYKKTNENEWIAPNGKLRVKITVDKIKDQFYVETRKVN